MTTASPSCRRCSAPIGGLPVEPLAAHWSRHDDPNPGAYAGRRCARCSWANVVPPQWLWEEDLAGLAQLVDVRELDTSDTSDPALALQRIRLARGALVSRLRTLVLQDPASARFWLMGALRQVGPDRTDEDYRLVVFLQQVYACLLSRGPVELTGGAPGVPTKPWVSEVTFLAAKATHLSALVRELQLDTVSAAVMRSGILRLAPSEQWTWIAEVNLNRAAQWGYRKDLSDAVDDVERQVYGTSATELMLGLWADLRRQSPGDGVSAGVAVVDLGSEGEPAQSRLRHLVLTRDRWRSRAVPSFFFADGRGAGKTDQALVVGAGEVDWLAFAPLLHGRSRHGQVAFTTSALLERALAQAVSSLSVRLHLATLTAKTSASSIAGEVNRRAREVHSRFEAEAAAECVSAGMRALDGVEALEGKRLEAGEIDVLAGGVGVERPVLLVGECKNLDFSFFKDSGPGQTRDVLRHATDQVLRKRAWVAANWGTVSRALRLPQIEPEVVGVVVTRTLAVPALDAGIPIVSIGELAELARTVIGTTAGAWPGALLARPRSGHV